MDSGNSIIILDTHTLAPAGTYFKSIFMTPVF